MKLLVKHRSYFDWKLMHVADVKEGDVALPSIHGPHFRHVQLHYLEPAVTEITLGDDDIDRMVADHEEGLVKARQGYVTKQVGGPLDGQEVTVPPRHLPHMTRNELIADHLQRSVFPFHFPGDAVTNIKIEHHMLEDEDANRLSKHLNRRFVVVE